MPNDPRGLVSDYAIIAERSERRLRFDRSGGEDFVHSTPGARYAIETDATSITFAFARSNLNGRYDAINQVCSVFVGGVPHSTFLTTDATKTLSLDGVIKRRVEIIWPISDPMDLLSTTVNEGAQFYTPAPRPTGVLAMCGDSITQGFFATKTVDSFAFKIAAAKTRQLINLADGGDGATPAYANALIGTGADRVCYTIGYNNFGDQTPLATFQMAVEGWITNARAALPAAKIYVISPVYSPNTNTLTLAQYRIKVAAAVTAVGDANATYIDGLSLMTNSNDRLNADLIHPNDTGHSEVATNLGALIS